MGVLLCNVGIYCFMARGSDKQPREERVQRAVTAYRVLMMLMTCVCILAVDFPYFDRRNMKVEAYGIALMDIGVGSIVFSMGVTSSAR